MVKDAYLFYGLAAADFTPPALSGRLFCSRWYIHSLGFEGEKHLNSKHGTLTKTKNIKEIKEFLVEKLSCIMKGEETIEIVLCAV